MLPLLHIIIVHSYTYTYLLLCQHVVQKHLLAHNTPQILPLRLVQVAPRQRSVCGCASTTFALEGRRRQYANKQTQSQDKSLDLLIGDESIL